MQGLIKSRRKGATVAKVASVAATSLLVIGILPKIATASAEDQWLPELTDSADLATVPVIQGRIVTESGQSFPRGTPVALYAYPSFEVISALEVGDSYELTPVAKATIDTDGRFQLRVADAGSLARFASKAGSIDFEVRAIDGRNHASYFLSRSLTDFEGKRVLVSTDAVDSGHTALKREATAGTPAVEIVSLTSDKDLTYAAPQGSTAINKTDVCGETLEVNLGNKPVVVGGTYTQSGSQARFEYTAGASSALGVGVSASGTYGSYSQSGTFSVSSTDVVGFGTRTGHYQYQTYFRYGKYSYWCYPVWNPDLKTILQYRVKANLFAAGSVVSSTSEPFATNCVPFAAGTTYEKSSTSAYEWATGASLSGSIGINLSSRTGYSSTAKLFYENTSSVSRWLCGSSDYPGGAPKRVVAKA